MSESSVSLVPLEALAPASGTLTWTVEALAPVGPFALAGLAASPARLHLCPATGTLTVERALEGGAAFAGALHGGSALGVLEERRSVRIRQRVRWPQAAPGRFPQAAFLVERLLELAQEGVRGELELRKEGALNGHRYQGVRTAPFDAGLGRLPPLPPLFDDGSRDWRWTAWSDRGPGTLELTGSFTQLYTTLAHRAARRTQGG